jgi:RecB family endonuclease NucS
LNVRRARVAEERLDLLVRGVLVALETHDVVEDIDHGARLKMTPADPAKLNEMRQHLKQHVQMMNQSHGCSMTADAGR